MAAQRKHFFAPGTIEGVRRANVWLRAWRLLRRWLRGGRP